MKWIVNIENKPQQRILVLFNILDEKLEFYGQYKIKTNWVNFSVDDTSISTTLEIIQEKLLSVTKKMDFRIKKYDDLNKSFTHIKKIEILDDSNNDIIENDIDDDQVYGFDPL
ncbi:MAG: hypothetical protein ACOC22_00390 [bacterium]